MAPNPARDARIAEMRVRVAAARAGRLARAEALAAAAAERSATYRQERAAVLASHGIRRWTPLIEGPFDHFGSVAVAMVPVTCHCCDRVWGITPDPDRREAAKAALLAHRSDGAPA